MRGTAKQMRLEKLKNKEYRDGLVESHVRTDLSYQIRALRKARDMSQEGLAGRVSSMTQSQVARYEDPDYGRFNLTTLLKLASAFDVALLVRFVAFSELLGRTEDLTPEGLNAVSFGDDANLGKPNISQSITDDSRTTADSAIIIGGRGTGSEGWRALTFETGTWSVEGHPPGFSVISRQPKTDPFALVPHKY